MNKREILFIHQAFPGQFASLAASLAAEGHNVTALAINPQGRLPKVNLLKYPTVRGQESSEIKSEILHDLEAKLIRAESIYEAMKVMKARGYNPDVIYSHPGWGEAMFIKNVWPDARLVTYAEWYYNMYGQEVNFDPAFPPLSQEMELRLSVKNTPFLHALSDADAAIAPSEWQKSRFPAWAQEKITVIHDGIDLRELASIKPRSLGIPSQNLKLRKGMPIITYATRHLEPLRGFHYFMRSLPEVLANNKEAHVIIMGQDAGAKTGGYGALNKENESWRETMRKELGDSVDWSRIHFLGMIDRKLYLAMLKLSACHVYLTTPFILSWSFLEAAALGLPIVASDVQPVREMQYLSGLNFVKFDDPHDIAQNIIKTLASEQPDYSPENLEKLRDFDHHVTLPKIREILLYGAPASDAGGPLEELIILDD